MLCCVGGALRHTDRCTRVCRAGGICLPSIQHRALSNGGSCPSTFCAARFLARRTWRGGEICLAARISPLSQLLCHLPNAAGQAGSTVLLCRSLLCYTVTRPPRTVEPSPRTVHSSNHAVERFHHAEKRTHRTENAPPRAGKPYHHTVEPSHHTVERSHHPVEPSHRTVERLHHTVKALPRAVEPFPRGLLPIEPTPATLN
jgi:hypothetical protein